MPNKPIRPIILTILDGWGYSESTHGNAIKLANTPNMEKIWNEHPNTLLSASGEDVGLPQNQMGNSEVGHTTIGAGRIINQDLVRIDKSIKEKIFFSNRTINNICQNIQKKRSQLHIIGLCSNGAMEVHLSADNADANIVTLETTKDKRQSIQKTAGRRGNGRKGRYWGAKISNVGGCDFSVYSLEFLLGKLHSGNK